MSARKMLEDLRERCAQMAEVHLHRPETAKESISAAYSNGTVRLIAAAIRQLPLEVKRVRASRRNSSTSSRPGAGATRARTGAKTRA